VDPEAEAAGEVGEEVVELGADGVRRRYVAELPPLVEGVGALPGAVDELVGDDEVSRRVVLPEAAHRRRSHDPLDAQLLQGPDVGPAVDPVRRDLMPPAVAGDEGDPAPPVGAEGDEVRRRPIRRVDLHLPRVLDDLGVVDARAADDGDLGPAFLCHIALYLL